MAHHWVDGHREISAVPIPRMAITQDVGSKRKEHVDFWKGIVAHRSRNLDDPSLLSIYLVGCPAHIARFCGACKEVSEHWQDCWMCRILTQRRRSMLSSGRQ